MPMFLMCVFAFAGSFPQSRIGARPRRSTIASLAFRVPGSALRQFSTNGWQMVGTTALLGLACAVVVAVLQWRVTPASYATAMKPSTLLLHDKAIAKE